MDDSAAVHNNLCRKKRKKEKNRKETAEEQSDIDERLSVGKSNEILKKKKKKKRSKRLRMRKVRRETVRGYLFCEEEKKKSAEQDNRAKNFVDKKDVNDEESSNSVKKKRKTKCKREECEEEVLVTANCDESDQRSKKKKKKTKAGEKLKKKKKNQNGKDIEAERQLEFNEKGAKKDRKGRVKMADSDAVENGGANDSQSDNYVGKKRKKKKERGSEDDPAPKKSKEVHEPEGQSGNTQTDPNTAYSGQWNTASLGDEQRQNKFLRLLGGFKAAKSDGSPLNTLGAKCGNVAMTQNQEDSYVRSMEDQYGKAMSFNQNRGLGLGFQRPPSEGKKFYIDKNISKSRKFDD
uniref:Small acidic protein n=1 Tax=Crassostrea virginica TaxID=6565 RepID=A0A8B8DWR9_CRAVI|nr:lysine-rich nucleolar protein 1-like [Crassostrea virginica]